MPGSQLAWQHPVSARCLELAVWRGPQEAPLSVLCAQVTCTLTRIGCCRRAYSAWSVAGRAWLSGFPRRGGLTPSRQLYQMCLAVLAAAPCPHSADLGRAALPCSVAVLVPALAPRASVPQTASLSSALATCPLPCVRPLLSPAAWVCLSLRSAQLPCTVMLLAHFPLLVFPCAEVPVSRVTGFYAQLCVSQACCPGEI